MNFISLLEVDEQDCWFQQQIQQCRCSSISLMVVFFSKLVAPSITGSIATGFLSLVVFKAERVQNNPHALEELKQNTELCISNVTTDTLHRVA
jgi:hypothetical protein